MMLLIPQSLGLSVQPQSSPVLRSGEASPKEILLPGLTPYGLVSKTFPSTEATYTKVGTSKGLGFKVSATGRRYSQAIFNGKGSYAWLVLAYRDASTTGTFSVVRRDGVCTPVQEANNTVRAISWPGAIATWNYSANGTIASYFDRFTVFSGRVQGTSAQLWRNSFPTTEVPSTTFYGTLSSNSNPLSIGATESGGEAATPWTTLLIVLWEDSIPSAARMVEYSTDPYRFFTTQQHSVWASVTAGTPFFITPKPYYPVLIDSRHKQPQQFAGITQSSPLSRDIVFAFSPQSRGRDATGRYNTVIFANSSIGVMGGYRSLVGTGTEPQGLAISTNSQAEIPFNNVIASGTPFTIAMGIVPFATGVREVFFSDFVSGGSSANINMEQTAGDQFALYNGGTVTTGSVVAGQPTDICFVRDASNLNGYINGIQGTPTALGTPGTGQRVSIGTPGAYGGGLKFRGGIHYCFVFNRAFSLSEVRALRYKVWQLFALPPTPSWLQARTPWTPRQTLMMGTSGETKRTVTVLTTNAVRRNTQPQRPVIDWDNPITKGMIFCVVGGIPVNLVSNRLGTRSGTVVTAVSKVGKSFDTLADGGANRIDFVGGVPQNSGDVLSYGSVFYLKTNSSFSYLINRGISVPGNSLFWLSDASKVLRLSFGDTGIWIGSTDLALNTWHVSSASEPLDGGASNAVVYSDGVLDIYNGGGNNVTSVRFNSSDTLILSGRVADNLRSLAGGQALSVSWNRPLSHKEHQSFNANPWQLFTNNSLSWVPPNEMLL